MKVLRIAIVTIFFLVFGFIALVGIGRYRSFRSLHRGLSMPVHRWGAGEVVGIGFFHDSFDCRRVDALVRQECQNDNCNAYILSTITSRILHERTVNTASGLPDNEIFLPNTPPQARERFIMFPCARCNGITQMPRP